MSQEGKSNKDPEFRVGDIVEAFGVPGKVEDTGDECVTVRFELDRKRMFFYPCGRLELWHKTPSLKLIERPKKKVWVNLYKDGHAIWVGGDYYPTRTLAEQNRYPAHECVGVGEIEVDDE